MAHHHAADSPGKFSKNRELSAVQFFPASIDARKVVMRVELGGSVTGKMLSTGEDACFQESVIERARELNHLLRRGPITSATQRIVCIILKRNVQDRAEV